MNQTVSSVGRLLEKKAPVEWDLFAFLRMVFLGALVLTSALAIVYLKDFARREFFVYEDLQEQAHSYQVNWGKLLLEQSAWSSQQRVQWIAEKNLHMVLPSKTNVLILKEKP